MWQCNINLYYSIIFLLFQLIPFTKNNPNSYLDAIMWQCNINLYYSIIFLFFLVINNRGLHIPISKLEQLLIALHGWLNNYLTMSTKYCNLQSKIKDRGRKPYLGLTCIHIILTSTQRNIIDWREWKSKNLLTCCRDGYHQLFLFYSNWTAHTLY
jgi:hypothetical protein